MDCRSTSKEEPAMSCFTVQPCCWQPQVTSARPNTKSGVKLNACVSLVWFHLQRRVGKLVRNLPLYVKYYTNSNIAHCYNIVCIISSVPLYSVLLLKHSSGTNTGQSYPKTVQNAASSKNSQYFGIITDTNLHLKAFATLSPNAIRANQTI